LPPGRKHTDEKDGEMGCSCLVFDKSQTGFLFAMLKQYETSTLRTESMS